MGQKPISIKSYKDLPPMAASMGRMDVNKTGSWRNIEPHYVEQTPPCNHLCPAGNDVVGFLNLTAEGRFEEAFINLALTTPFPSVCGRVCPHPCETECNRNEMGGKLNVHLVERFLGDRFLENPPPLPKSPSIDKKVAIIGAGPAGLSAAYHLALRGVDVTIYESQPVPGGLLNLGIPYYRLPKDILKSEIDRIISLGVKINCNVKVGVDVKFEYLIEQFDAVLASTGLTKSKSLGVKNDDISSVVTGLSILRSVKLGLPITVGNRVLVVGGGNTAMDVARTLLRLGRDVKVVYRRTINEMPAIREEVDALIEERIPIEFLTAPVELVTRGDEFVGLRCVKMELGAPDASGRRRPVEVKGSEYVEECDSVVTAIGEETDLFYLPDNFHNKKTWNIPADDVARTSIPKFFACGDAVDGAGTVTAAIGFGRKAANAIKAFLCDEELPENVVIPPSLQQRQKHIVRFDELNLSYFKEMERIHSVELPIEERINTFDEVIGGLNEIEVVNEAKRCFSCGTCPSCDNCYIFCPDAVITKLGDDSDARYIVNFDYCKGCGVCAAECPRNCIEMRLPY